MCDSNSAQSICHINKVLPCHILPIKWQIRFPSFLSACLSSSQLCKWWFIVQIKINRFSFESVPIYGRYGQTCPAMIRHMRELGVVSWTALSSTVQPHSSSIPAHAWVGRERLICFQLSNYQCRACGALRAMQSAGNSKFGSWTAALAAATAAATATMPMTATTTTTTTMMSAVQHYCQWIPVRVIWWGSLRLARPNEKCLRTDQNELLVQYSMSKNHCCFKPCPFSATCWFTYVVALHRISNHIFWGNKGIGFRLFFSHQVLPSYNSSKPLTSALTIFKFHIFVRNKKEIMIKTQAMNWTRQPDHYVILISLSNRHKTGSRPHQIWSPAMI